MATITHAQLQCTKISTACYIIFKSLQDREEETLEKALAFEPPFSSVPSLLRQFGNLEIYMRYHQPLLVEWRHYEDLDIATIDILQLRTDTEVNNHTFSIFFNTC